MEGKGINSLSNSSPNTISRSISFHFNYSSLLFSRTCMCISSHFLWRPVSLAQCLVNFLTTIRIKYSPFLAAATVEKPPARIVPPAQRGTPFSGSANNALDLTGTQTPTNLFTSAHLTAQKAAIGPTVQSADITTAVQNPKEPDGYTLVFGPTGGANNSPGVS